MGSAFVRGDFISFAKYTYPPIVESIGGIAKMAEILEKTVGDMRQKGMSFNNITFDEPSKIIAIGKEYQATIVQHADIKLTKGRLVNTTTLIAISIDNGNDWTFIDTSNKDIAILRKSFPNLSPSIYIPQQKPPVKFDF